MEEFSCGPLEKVLSSHAVTRKSQLDVVCGCFARSCGSRLETVRSDHEDDMRKAERMSADVVTEVLN